MATIQGSVVPEILIGSTGDDIIFGLGGNDTINGGGGNDQIFGDVTSPYFAYNGKFYLLSNAGTWTQAQAQAVSLGGNLVTVNDATENQFLVNTFGGTEGLWIGLTDEGLNNDIFVIAVGNGSDVVQDLQDGFDKMGLSGGLLFSQLTILGSGTNTLIKNTSSGETFATLQNVSSTLITNLDFISV